MGIRLPGMVHAKQVLGRSLRGNQAATARDIPKGHVAVYVGEQEKKRFVIPISYLKNPLFQTLLNRVDEEFGFNHYMGSLTIPCDEDAFLNLTSSLNGS